MSLEISTQDYNATISKADNAIADLKKTLADITVNVGANSVALITAIRYIFGDSYIQSDGSSVITYEMYSQVINNLRKVGTLKVEEAL